MDSSLGRLEVYERIGIETFDLNQNLVLIESQEECSFTEIFEFLLNSVSSLQSVSAELEVSSELILSDRLCFLVLYRLDGQRWFAAQTFGICSSEMGIQRIARKVSAEYTSTRVIAFEQSDTGIFRRYASLEGGFSVEEFSFCESGIYNLPNVDFQNFRNSPSVAEFLFMADDQIEDYGGEIPFDVNFTLYSTLRNIYEEEIGDPYRFLSDTFESLGIYIPGIIWLIEENKSLRESFVVSGRPIEFRDFVDIAFAQSV